jgi:hypothetical protein
MSRPSDIIDDDRYGANPEYPGHVWDKVERRWVPKNQAKKARNPNGEIVQGVSGSVKPRFELVAFDDVRIDTLPAYCIKGIFPRVGLCVVYGPPKCGKSFLVFDMAMHVALGWEYRGKKVRRGDVVYCALEGCAAFKNRIEAFRQTRLAEHAGAVPFYLMASPLSLVADHPALIACIRAQTPNPAIVRYRHLEPLSYRIGKQRRRHVRLRQGGGRHPGRLQLSRGHRPPLRP